MFLLKYFCSGKVTNQPIKVNDSIKTGKVDRGCANKILISCPNTAINNDESSNISNIDRLGLIDTEVRPQITALEDWLDSSPLWSDTLRGIKILLEEGPVAADMNECGLGRIWSSNI